MILVRGEIMDELMEDFSQFCAYEGDNLAYFLEGFDVKGKLNELVRSEPPDLRFWSDRGDTELAVVNC